ncbi:MAG: class I SAM-dependent methyltransferase [Thiogranum sp.]|nr:class I SAM-dependent methyltransferase [Thiogranum sp.]
MKLPTCLLLGGGVPYTRYSRFHEIMAQDSGQTVLPALLEHILPLAAGLDERLKDGARVLDVGCGRGRALLLMAQHFPDSQFTGYDLSAEAVSWAQEQVRRQGLDNLRFETRDLTDFEHSAEPEVFDLVTTFDAVHDQARPLAVLRGIFRTLKPGGIYLMQDIHASSHVHNNHTRSARCCTPFPACTA